MDSNAVTNAASSAPWKLAGVSPSDRSSPVIPAKSGSVSGMDPFSRAPPKFEESFEQVWITLWRTRTLWRTSIARVYPRAAAHSRRRMP